MNDRNNPTPHLAGAKHVAQQHPHTPAPGELPDGKHPAHESAPARTDAVEVERVWERWFWRLLETSWSDVWRVVRRWEIGLRPDSQPLTRIWFAAWMITGFSGVMLLLSLLLTPTPQMSRSGVSFTAGRRTSSGPLAGDAGTRNPASNPQILPATSSDFANKNTGHVRHADYEAESKKLGKLRSVQPDSDQSLPVFAPASTTAPHNPVSAPSAP